MKPNVLFLVIDSLRADACSNTESSLMPNIESIKQNRIFFNQAISSIPSTSAAMATIFTGLFPFRLGMGSEKYSKLNPDIPTFIEHLKKNGYNTYATTSEVNSLLGITADFDLQLRQTLHKNYDSLFAGLGEKILKKLESMEEPWFFYIHLNDLHKPIIVPPEFSDQKFGLTDYEKMVSAIDYWLGKFLTACQPHKTLIVITSDHGEYLSSLKVGDKIINFEPSSIEKSLWKIGNKVPPQLYGTKRKLSDLLHKLRHENKRKKIKNLNLSQDEERKLLASRMDPGTHVHDDLLRVPLIFYGLEINQNNILQQVRHVDVFPTIFELIGLPPLPNPIDGKSLVNLINSKELPEEPAYFESMPHIEENHKKIIGIRFNGFKYFRGKNDSSNVQLFDLNKDPFEMHNLSKNKLDVVKKMENILQDILKKISVRVEEPLTDKDRKKVEDELRKLGYL